MSALLALGSIAAGVGSSLFGMSKAAKRAKQAEQFNKENYAAAVDDYWKNENPILQRADMQELARRTNESILEANKQASNPIANNTTAGVNAAKQQGLETSVANTRSMTSTAAGLHQQNQNNLATARNQYTTNEMQIKNGQAQAITSAATGLGQTFVEGGINEYLANKASKENNAAYNLVWGN